MNHACSIAPAHNVLRARVEQSAGRQPSATPSHPPSPVLNPPQLIAPLQIWQLMVVWVNAITQVKAREHSTMHNECAADMLAGWPPFPWHLENLNRRDAPQRPPGCAC